LEGASISLDNFGFAAADAGGAVIASLAQRRPGPNIAIDLAINNEPGGVDSPFGAAAINGGPVQRLKFEYDSTIDPNNGVAATVGQTTILFDFVGDDNGVPPGFDGLQYIASYVDLIAAFGANRAAGAQHYLTAGQAEGRQADLFGETQYLRNYGDLRGAFGTDVNAATSHFITNGLNEGRIDDAPSPAQIDGLQYIASSAESRRSGRTRPPASSTMSATAKRKAGCSTTSTRPSTSPITATCKRLSAATQMQPRLITLRTALARAVPTS
jgi:hypothetical protein